MATWTNFKNIEIEKIVLKAPVKAQGVASAYTSWINYGNGPLRFKLPPGQVGFPPQPYTPGQIGAQTFNYQLHAERVYHKPDGSASLVGQAQRDLIAFMNNIEDFLIDILVKDPQAFHPKYPKDADKTFFRSIWSNTIKPASDPKWPSAMKIKLVPHKENPVQFQGRNFGKDTEPLVMECENEKINVDRDSITAPLVPEAHRQIGVLRIAFNEFDRISSRS